MKGISFNAILNRITTTIDGGWRISFDVPQSEVDEVMRLSALREEAIQLCAFTSVMIANMKHDDKADYEEHG